MNSTRSAGAGAAIRPWDRALALRSRCRLTSPPPVCPRLDRPTDRRETSRFACYPCPRGSLPDGFVAACRQLAENVNLLICLWLSYPLAKVAFRQTDRAVDPRQTRSVLDDGLVSLRTTPRGRMAVGCKTAAPLRTRHTAGRGQMPSAVRKAEARPPAPDPVSQVAADFEARVVRPRGPDATGRLRPTRNARAAGPTSATPGLVVLCLCSRAHQPTLGVVRVVVVVRWNRTATAARIDACMTIASAVSIPTSLADRDWPSSEECRTVAIFVG